MSERLPAPVPARIRATAPSEDDLLHLSAGTRLVRIHPLGGLHPCQWNQFRAYGPTKSRFDHHTTPPRVQGRRIAYLTHGADAFTAAVAEYFQDDSGAGVQPIDLRRGAPNVTAFELSTDMTLLNLDGGWVTRAGGNQAIRTGPRGRAREWARAMYAHHRRLIEGFAYSSSVWGPGTCVALWETAISAFPPRPLATRQLSDPAMESAVARAALELDTSIL